MERTGAATPYFTVFALLPARSPWPCLVLTQSRSVSTVVPNSTDYSYLSYCHHTLQTWLSFLLPPSFITGFISLFLPVPSCLTSLPNQPKPCGSVLRCSVRMIQPCALCAHQPARLLVLGQSRVSTSPLLRLCLQTLPSAAALLVYTLIPRKSKSHNSGLVLLQIRYFPYRLDPQSYQAVRPFTTFPITILMIFLSP